MNEKKKGESIVVKPTEPFLKIVSDVGQRYCS